MTGYLHIPDDAGLRDKIALALDSCCKDCALDPAGAQQRNAEQILTVLRGLSVEPTEPTDEQTAAATDRLMMSHPSWFKRLSTVRNRSPQDPGYQAARYAALTLATAVLRAVAAPVPVQEDRQ